jgi:hypothetical protein
MFDLPGEKYQRPPARCFTPLAAANMSKDAPRGMANPSGKNYVK